MGRQQTWRETQFLHIKNPQKYLSSTKLIILDGAVAHTTIATTILTVAGIGMLIAPTDTAITARKKSIEDDFSISKSLYTSISDNSLKHINSVQSRSSQYNYSIQERQHTDYKKNKDYTFTVLLGGFGKIKVTNALLTKQNPTVLEKDIEGSIHKFYAVFNNESFVENYSRHDCTLDFYYKNNTKILGQYNSIKVLPNFINCTISVNTVSRIIQNTIIHEMAHLCTATVSGNINKVPVLLMEGIARATEYDILSSKSINLHYVMDNSFRTIKDHQLTSLAELIDLTSNDTIDPYMLGYVYVSYCQSKSPSTSIIRYLSELRLINNENFDPKNNAALNKLFNVCNWQGFLDFLEKKTTKEPGISVTLQPELNTVTSSSTPDSGGIGTKASAPGTTTLPTIDGTNTLLSPTEKSPMDNNQATCQDWNIKHIIGTIGGIITTLGGIGIFIKTIHKYISKVQNTDEPLEDQEPIIEDITDAPPALPPRYNNNDVPPPLPPKHHHIYTKPYSDDDEFSLESELSYHHTQVNVAAHNDEAGIAGDCNSYYTI